MNQPPNSPYFNASQQRKQAQGFPQSKAYKSSRNPVQSQKQFTQQKGRTNGNMSSSSERTSVASGVERSGQRRTNELDWSELTELPIKPKTLHRRLVDFITVAVILALIAGGTITYFNLSNNQSSGKPAVVNVIVPTEIAETPSIGVLGKPTQAGEWMATIKHFKTVTNHELSNQNQVYLEVEVTLKNTSATSQILAGFLEFVLEDASGNQIHEALNDPDIRQPVTGYVAAGETLQAQIAFAVPKSTRSYTLHFHYGLVENSTASVNWPLTL